MARQPMDVLNGLVAPVVAGLLLALITGGVAWARSISRAAYKVAGLTEQLAGIAADVRDLAAAATQSVLTQAKLDAHTAQAEDRWSWVVRSLLDHVPLQRGPVVDAELVP